MTRIRNASSFGDLIVNGHGVIASGEEIETDDRSLIESPNFEVVAQATRKVAAKKATHPHVKKVDKAEGNA